MNELLLKQVQNHTIHQVYIFEGSKESVQKEYIEFSKLVMNTQKDVLNFIEVISPINKNISIDEVRDVKKRIFEHPSEFGFKIIVFEEVHFMKVEAQNAILKTLEELPNYAIVIMTTDNRFKLLLTILSRSQVVKLIGKTDDFDELYTNIKKIISLSLEKKYYIISKEKDIRDKLSQNKLETINCFLNIFSNALFYKKGVFKFDDDLFYGQISKLSFLKLEKLIFELQKIKELLNVNINFQIALERILFIIMEA